MDWDNDHKDDNKEEEEIDLNKPLPDEGLLDDDVVSIDKIVEAEEAEAGDLPEEDEEDDEEVEWDEEE